jgi:hypothetical protein
LTSLRISPCAHLSSHELSARARSCPPECSATRRHGRKSASFSFETAALSEVFPLARLLFSKTFRPPFHLAHSGKELSLRAPSFPPTTRQTRIIAANGVKDQGVRGGKTGKKALIGRLKYIFQKIFNINPGGGSGIPAAGSGGPAKRAGSMPVRRTGRRRDSAKRTPSPAASEAGENAGRVRGPLHSRGGGRRRKTAKLPRRGKPHARMFIPFVSGVVLDAENLDLLGLSLHRDLVDAGSRRRR